MSEEKEIEVGSALDGHVCIIIGDLKDKLNKAEAENKRLREEKNKAVKIFAMLLSEMEDGEIVLDHFEQALAEKEKE